MIQLLRLNFSIDFRSGCKRVTVLVAHSLWTYSTESPIKVCATVTVRSSMSALLSCP